VTFAVLPIYHESQVSPNRSASTVLTHHLSDILREKGGDYELVVFHRDAVAWLESQLFDKRGTPYPYQRQSR